MPFKSKAQRRKFYAMKSRGEISQKTIDEWEKDTPKNLPKVRAKTKTKKNKKAKHFLGHRGNILSAFATLGGVKPKVLRRRIEQIQPLSLVAGRRRVAGHFLGHKGKAPGVLY